MSENASAPETAPAADGGRRNRMPPQVACIVGSEACERFSYYGMSGILVLYMTSQLHLEEGHSKEIAHLSKMAIYFLPLLGAWIADRWLGRYWTIMSLSLFYCLGHGVLAFGEGTRWGLFLGLALIAFGAGGIKPCVSAFMGDQFGPERKHLLPKAFGLFYWAINFGSFFAFLVIPWTREHYGYGWAFGIPGILMLLAWIVFAAGTPMYVRVPPAGPKARAGFFTVLCAAIRKRRDRQNGQSFLDAARPVHGDEAVGAAKMILGILGIFAVAPFFWALFDQTSTSWILQGNRMVPYTVCGWTLDAEKMQSFNPALVMVLIPFLTSLVYPLLARRGRDVSPLPRMGAGMGLAAAAFVVCGLLQLQIEAGMKLSILWQLLPYLLLTTGEVLFSATGLEFAYAQAPASMKSTVTSFWNLTVAFGNLLVVAVTVLNTNVVHAQGALEFFFYAGLIAVVTAVFVLLSRRFRRQAAAGN
jgi:POT family proton-dependent oligopeptide transporter